MTATKGKPRRRFSREQQQENRSRGQLVDRLSEPGIGWIVSPVETDMGEDLHVRIYDKGVSTGLSFDVQLKSTSDSEKLKKKKTASLAYPLEVKDLLHWEVATTLVVLVVWDVEKRAGWWQSIPEVIKELDAGSKKWRKQKSIAVSIPLQNTTDAEGMKWLRRAIADYWLPIVPKHDTEHLLVFDDTEEAKTALKAFADALDAGEPFAFEQGFIPTIEFPSWHRRIYGLAGPGELIKVEITPAPSNASKAVRIEVESPEGSASFPYVELRPKVRGRKRLVLTNELQKLPVVFALDLNAESTTFSFRKVSHGSSLYEAREVAAFMLAATTPGSVIHLINPVDGEPIASVALPRTSTNHAPENMRRWRDILDKLIFIQQRMTGGEKFSPEKLREITWEDVEAIEHVFRAFREGKIKLVETLSSTFAPTGEQIPDGPSKIQVNLRDVRANVLGLEIPLGDVRLTIIDSDRYLNAVRNALVEANATGKDVDVKLEDMQVVAEYSHWLPGGPPWFAMDESLINLTKISGPSDGYVTRSDVRAAGVTDTVFDALLSTNKIEQIAPDVFRLLHMPRADREELISLWLQTDRKGILSHDTALFLNEISDILPRRRHITVPPGWSPGARQLDPDVVLHHAEVGEDEIRWLGPIPYTAPLRTVRDCIATHVMPDLIEQAIAEGVQRGMFTKADVTPDTTRGAA